MENSDQNRRANFSSMTDSVPFFSARLIFLRLMFRKLTLSWPVAWWYSMVCLLLTMSPELVFLVCPALSSELAWDSDMMEAVTTGGDMCTFSLVPTSSLMVALNLVLVFKT